jgi:AcrR family transcriptional regulator
VPRKANLRPDEPGREKILDAARSLFGERGYDATSIAEIGASAGISKSVLYHYFGSKAGLYQALLEHDGREIVAAVAAAVPPPGVITPRLRPGLDAFLRYLSEHPDTWRLMARDPPADPRLRALYEQIDGSVAATRRQLLARPGDPDARPALVELVALAVRTFASWWQDNPEIPREDIVDALVDIAATGAHRIRPPD